MYFVLTPMVVDDQMLRPVSQDFSIVRCPDTRNFVQVEEALAAGRAMTFSAFARLYETSMRCSAICIEVEDDDNRPVLSEIVLRGQLICPNCGSIDLKSESSNDPVRKYGYDRDRSVVVELVSTTVTKFTCASCGHADKAHKFSSGVDLASYKIASRGGRSFGPRYVSCREWRNTDEHCNRSHLEVDTRVRALCTDRQDRQY